MQANCGCCKLGVGSPCPPYTGSRAEMDQVCTLKQHGLISCRRLPSSLHPVPPFALQYRCAWCSPYNNYTTRLHQVTNCGIVSWYQNSIKDLNRNFKVTEHKSQVVKAWYWICSFGPGGLWKLAMYQCLSSIRRWYVLFLPLLCCSRKQPWWSLPSKHLLNENHRYINKCERMQERGSKRM